MLRISAGIDDPTGQTCLRKLDGAMRLVDGTAALAFAWAARLAAAPNTLPAADQA